MRVIITFVTALLLQFPLCAQDSSYVGDTDSINHIIAAFYGVISGGPGQRDWERFENLFTEDARLNAKIFDRSGKSRYIIGSVQDYVKGVDEFFLKEGFYEREIGRSVLQYSDLVTLFSSFESKLKENGPVYQRGINCLQLIFLDDRWYIANAIYNTEKKNDPLPKEFLYEQQ